MAGALFWAEAGFMAAAMTAAQAVLSSALNLVFEGFDVLIT